MLITIDKTIKELHGIFEQNFSVQYLDSNEISKENLKDSVALIIRSTRKYGAETLQNTGVKFIGTVTSGFEHIDTDFCEKNNIFWTSAHGSNAESVAEYIAAALCEIPQKRTLGIVGVGAVGSLVKRDAEKLGIKTFLCDPPKNLNDNIFEADVITLHCPLNRETHNLVNDDFLKKMKNGAWLINAARGAVCNSDSLKRAAHLGGIIIDTWENEPNIDASLFPFVKIATPHIAGHSAQAKINAANMMLSKINEYFKLNLKLLPNLPKPSGIYLIKNDDFRNSPNDFTKIRNGYKRQYLKTPSTR